ncbi:MAG: hypothetical protein IT379_14205 [Deltaproteobacteria bacterium]|nr:hypothetical protein [Deltaproteobacteria bacterium]
MRPVAAASDARSPLLASAWGSGMAVAMAALVGCTAESGPGPAGLSEGSLGVLVIERRSPASGEAAELPAALGASFARYRGVGAEAVLDIVGSPVLTEGCVDLGARTDGPDVAEAEIELLDVGPIRVAAASSSIELSPRTFPAVGDLLAGVFYAGEAELPPADAVPTYDISAPGNAEVGALEATLPAAAPPAGLRVDGAIDGERVPRGRDLVLSWTDGGRAEAFVEVVVSRADGVAGAACTSVDDGSISVPASMLARVRGSGAHVRVRRVLVRQLEIAGLDRAEARIVAGASLDVDLE